MSDILTVFDPATSTTTQFLAGTNSAFGTTLFWNESNISLFLTFQNGDVLYLPAWYVRHKTGLTGNVNVTWDVHTVLNSGQVPTSEVIVESYNSDEPYPPDGPLVRQANGNTNSTAVGNTLINTGNAPGTSVIDIQPSGATSPTISADNSGNFSVSGDNAGTLTTLLQLIAGASPAVKLAAATLVTEVLGDMKLDGAINGVSITNNAGGSLLQLGSSVANHGDVMDATTGSVFFKAPSGGFQFQVPNGTSRWSRGAEAKFTGTGTGSFTCPYPGSFDIALTNPCTLSGSTQTIGVSFACPFQVTVAGGLGWMVLIIKF